MTGSYKKIVIIILLVLALSGSVFLFPQSADAQFASLRIPQIAENIWKVITTASEKIYNNAAAAAFKTALSQFLNKMAYDMAMAVATGAPGQKSLIFDDPNYFINLGGAVMGNAVDEIAQESGFTNLMGTTSLCEPADLTTKVNLLLSFKTPTEPVMPSCSLSQMKKSLAESANSFTNSFSLQNLSLRFEMGDLEEARNSLRQALTVEKYLSSGAAIDNELSDILTKLEGISDETAALIQSIYQKPIDERQAAADSVLEKMSNLMTRLNQTQNEISELKGTIVYCNSSAANCSESAAAGMCMIFVNVFQPNCTAAVQASQTYIDQFQKFQTDLTEGVNNFYTGVLEKAFTVPDASDPKDIANAFNPPAYDMGKYFLIKEAKDRNINIKIENEKLLQRISKDCEPKKDPISGMNVLPASAACGMFNFAMSKATVNEETYTGTFSQALSIFTNTLAGKLLQNWFEKGVASFYGKGKGKNTTSAADLASGGAPRGKGAAEEKFLTLLQSNFTAGGPFEVLKELTVCPEKGAGPNNCIIDSDFSQAIAERLTLKEAMDKKLLDPKKSFGYIKSGSILVEPSYLSGYPYRSMIVLRKFRIIPVGWELAAEWIKDPGKNTDKVSYTLKQVVDCYENTNDCVFDVNNGEPNHFYHLLDPGWVFLEQPAFCKRQGTGEKILAEEFVCSQPDTANKTCSEYSRSVYRQEYCADEQTCLLKNDDGSCRFYGYCSLDQPSWKLDGASCNQEYNSCQTYGNEDGVNVSYLEHSISSGGCNAGNANCRWYCEEAPLICSGGSQNGAPCSNNNDCAPTAGGIVDGVCRPTDLWKCQGKNLINNPSVEINSVDWAGFGAGVNNRIDTKGHESFASLSATSTGAESGFRFNPAAFSAGESIDVSGWVNVDIAPNGSAALRLKDVGANIVIAESERIADLDIWKPIHLSATLSADANIAVELVSYGIGTIAFFDNIGQFLGNRISFDKDVKQCEAKNAGCREFLRTVNGANLIFNPSFEIKENNYAESVTANWYGWHLPYNYTASTDFSLNGPVSRDESNKFSGEASLRIDVGAGSSSSIGSETADPKNNAEEEHKLMPEDFYTFSIYAKAQTACVGNCLSLIGDCKIGDGGEKQQEFSLTTSWERYSFEYSKNRTVVGDGDYCRFYVKLNPSNTYWLDDAKIETPPIAGQIGSRSTNYKDYGSEKIYLNESRLSCDPSEVGCELYTPVDGDIGIPAVAKVGDQCPAECVGYETYHEIPSYFDPEEDAPLSEIFPNLIPETATQCTASAIGCEEFTNLDTVASGGEAKKYYTYIRQCAKPGATTEATYYTWEGSEEAGFQLRAWRLKAKNDGTPFTTDGTITCDLADPDCRIFYTQSGQPYERSLSKTVFISNDCHPLRRTVEGTEDDCTTSGGRWEDPDGDLLGICFYNAIPSQGLKCPAKYAGCREYKGPKANSAASLFKYDFEDPLQTGDWTIAAQVSEAVSVGGHSAEIAANPFETKREISSLVKKDKTYLLKFWAKADTNNDTSVSAFFINDDGDPLIPFGSVKISQEWNSYILGPADFTTRDPKDSEKLLIKESSSSQSFYIDNIEFIEVIDDVFAIKNSWTTPVSCDLNPLGISENLSADINELQATIPIAPPVDFPNVGVYSVLIDSEVISYIGIAADELLVVKRGERGTIPAIHSNGAKVLLLEQGYALHCSSYSDRAKTVHNLKSFSKLCREDYVGCEFLADTQNSSSPFAEWKSAEYIPADALTPMVNDDKKYCDPKSKGCQKFGIPLVDASDNITGWNSVYFINNPDNYQEILCQNTENWCKEYKTPDGAEKYFKDPGERICEYKENIGVGNTVASGWFIKGQYDDINPPECAGAMRHCSISKNGAYLFCREDPDCQPVGKNGLPEDLGTCIAKDTEWAKECPASQSSCTEYIDPLFSRTQGVKDRYYYLSDTIDESQCKGKIDEEQKCVAFNKSENPIRNTRASGTCKDPTNPTQYCTTNAECAATIPGDVCLMVSDRPFDPQACVRCSVDQLTCNPDPTKPNPCCSAVTDAGQIACSANSILYVQKDRDCREWLSCVSSAKITNARGEKEEVCYDVARCTQIDPVTGSCLKQAKDVNYCQATLPGANCDLATNTCVSEPSRSCEKDSECAKLCSSDAQCLDNIGPCDQINGWCYGDNTRVCIKDYQCFNDEGPCIADSQTYDSPLQTDVPPHASVVDDLRYRSGFNPYGAHWTDSGQIRNGEYLQTAAIQKGQVMLFDDGDFEKQDSLWSRFSTCSNTFLGAGRQCVNNSSCHAGDICDQGAGTCAVSGFSCINNNQCNISDFCGGVCSNNASVRCRDDSNCTAPGTCDLAAMVCYVNGNACRNDNVILSDPVDDFADDAMCARLDVCSNPRDFEYERVKVLSGLRSLKLGPGESAFQGNYPGAVNFNDNAPIFVTGGSQIAFSGYINTADLKSGEARVMIQEFKNGASAFEYAKAPITVMKQGPNKSWSFYAGIFTTDPEAVSIRVVLEVAAGSASSAYFDNFLMLPVLNYQNQSYSVPFKEVYDPENTNRPGENPFIGRSCRLYPQTSAPACSYTDEQKQQFLGWRGFCVEPDPANPLQCLQWLPIDQIQGEAGLGFKTESSYSGRTPLYYCAEMSLWQLRCNSRDGGQWNGYSQNECPTSSGVDPSCPMTYSKQFNRSGSWLNRKGSAYCWVNQVSGRGNNRDCFWVPYRSCPYGSKDMAKDISPNLIGRCDKLVEVIDSEGQNISWANRLDQKIFEFATPYGYIYNADQNSPLYGSILAIGQSNQSPELWQTTFGEEFIRFGTTVRDDTTIAKNNGTASPTYPLWVVPKSEDGLYWCSGDNKVLCTPSNDSCPGLGKGTCISSGQEIACNLSFGGSPAACNNSFCYNNSPALSSSNAIPRQCSATDPARSFEISVSQNRRPGFTPTSGANYSDNSAYPQNNSKANKETFIQGVQRIQHLFAKSYASYVWNAGQCTATDSADVCTGVCNDDNVTRCIDDTYCASGLPGVCQTNQETGNSCETTATGYHCSVGNVNQSCVNEVDQICATNGWGNCVFGAYADDCNMPSGKCTPAGGGVCRDSATGYIGKVCSPACLGGSCLQLGNCTIGGASCDLSDPNNCANGANGPCINPAWKCQGGVNPGAACDQVNDCTNSSITPSCVSGGGSCGGFPINSCSGGDFNGLNCDASGNVSITAEICVNKRCFNGASLGGFCPGTGADPNSDGIGDDTCDTANGEYCRNPADIGAPPQVCSPGGYSCSISGATCDLNLNPCALGSGDCIYTGMRQCTIDADCAGTTSYNSCFTFNNRCAIIEDLGDPDRVRGIEKAGSYCDNINNNPCRSADGLDNGVCATLWCSDGPFMQFQCVNTNPDCLLIGPEYTYVNAADIDDPAPDPRFSQTLWNPPANQCPINNQRAYATQPPDKDIRLETGEMCGVAPRIRFIKKPGDSSVPSDIEIDSGNSATINFLTMIDAEQKPIRNIRIDWGTANDNSDQIGVGPYADGTGLAPKTLDSDPFIFTSSPYQIPGIYTVKVMVQDNWYWCNGELDKKGYYGKASYCANNTNQQCTAANEVADCGGAGLCTVTGCDNIDSTNWLSFPGRIIVK